MCGVVGGQCVRNGPPREKAGRLVAPRFASWRRQQMVFSRVSSFRLLSIARHTSGLTQARRSATP